jgi:hypothetical protein
VSDKFEWDGERGVGFYPVSDPRPVYNSDYFKKYLGYAETEMGKKLTEARINLVKRHVPENITVVDIGIGCGQFVKERPHTFGYDVNPTAIRHLLGKDKWWDPYQYEADVITMWDSLEHMRWPEDLLRRVTSWVFVSIPIFASREHALQSKHFRTDEHYWYFTRDGLVALMSKRGYECKEQNTMEISRGREDIWSFAFRRPDAKI